MSLISGKYWTGDPKIKPDAWGPFEDVQAAIRENADRVYGFKPGNIKAYIPFWEMAGYNPIDIVIGSKNYFDYTGNVVLEKNAANFNSTSTPSFVFSKQPLIQASSDVCLVITLTPHAWYGGYPGIFRSGLYGTSREAFTFIGSTGLPWIFWDGGDVLKPSSGYSLSLNNKYTVCFYVSSNDHAYFISNGKIQHSASHSRTTREFEFHRYGFNYTLTEFVKGLHDNLLILQNISLDSAIKLTDNPYGLLQPITRRSYFIPSGEITIKTISDSGFCSDNISGISNQLSVIDIGSGIDGFYGMSAELYVSDAGVSSESVKPIAAISVNDTASAIDAITQILSYCSVVDSGSAADSIANILASVAVTDAGSGFDIITVLKELLKTVTDSCSCVDAISQITVSSSVSDSASGIDILSQVLADISVADNGSGADFLSLITDILKTISDAGTGVDSVSIQPVSVSVQDVGLALDLIGNIAVELSITDSATADEIISTIKTKLIAVSDYGIGSDNQSISVSLTVADTMTAIDAIKQIINSLSISDAGFGIESISKIDLDNTPTGHVRITITLKAPGISITSRSQGINISTQ